MKNPYSGIADDPDRLKRIFDGVLIAVLGTVMGAIVMGAGLVVWKQAGEAKQQVGMLAGQMAVMQINYNKLEAEHARLKERMSNLDNVLLTLDRSGE